VDDRGDSGRRRDFVPVTHALAVRNTALIGALVLLASTARRLEAQTVDALYASCAAAGGTLVGCGVAAATTQSILSGLGLLGGLGSEVPGTASALGARVGGGPRFAISTRAGAVRVSMPDVADLSGLDEASFFVPVVQAALTVGLFDGVRLMPTVGGFLSADLFAQISFVSLPQPEGFVGSARSYSAGVRVGILRESFTLPGVSVSVARRFQNSVQFGGVAFGTGRRGDIAEVAIDPAVTSLRATIGKDLFAVEVMAGIGWDEYSAEATARVGDGVGGFVTGSGDVGRGRLLYFGSVSMTVNIVFALAVEAGWARGLGTVAGYGGSFDTTAATPFGSFSFRLTL
jgi:hypothetical protein